MKLTLETADKSNKIYTLILILLVFIFCIAVRLTWVYQFSNQENFKWNDEFMVVTNDSYYFAEGARDIAFCQKDNASMGEYYQQNCHQEFDLSPTTNPLSQITALLYKLLPIKIETIFFYMPAVVASFVVIPIILVSRRLHMTTSGIIAALLTGIGTSYYNRTMVGYYDTDMLNLFFPLMIFMGFALALKTQERKYIYLIGLSFVLFRWWYPQSYTIELAFVGIAVLYALIDIFKFEGNKNFYFELFSIVFISLIWLTEFYGIVAVTLLFVFICLQKDKRLTFFIFIVTFLLALVYFVTAGIQPVWALLKIYIFRDSVFLLDGEVKLHFFSVMQTIIESGGSSGKPFDIIFNEGAQRISLHPVVFIISIAGYIWLCIKKPIFLFMFPILAIGLLSFTKGIRFSMFAVPVCSFGLAFFITQFGEILKKLFEIKHAGLFTAIFISLASLLCIYPLIDRAYNYRAGTVFTKEEVSLLDDLKSKISKEDYIISWWDYGYPLRYYADSKTLIDGGKHEGAENFPVSYMLGSDQKSAANLARLDVEYTENRYKIERDNQNLSDEDQIKIPDNNIAWMMSDYAFKNSNDFLLSLRTDMNLPKKTRDIYFYLPYRMIDIFPTILRFSNRDLMSGNEFRGSFWLLSRNAADSETVLQLDNGFIVNKQQGTFTTPQKQTIPLKRYVTTWIQDGNTQKQIQNINLSAEHSLVHLRSYGNTFLLIDEKMYNSLYFQMFYLGNFDENLFELVSSNPYAKIYKLKI